MTKAAISEGPGERIGPAAGRGWAAEVAILLAIAIGLRVFNFYGFYGSDDSAYLDLARTLAEGGEIRPQVIDRPTVFGCRVGVYGPVAALLRWIRPVETGMAVYPFAMSLVGVLAVWWAGRIWIGGRAGLGAGLLMAGLPMDTINASQLLPDLPGSAWSLAGIVLVEWGRRSDRPRRRFGWAVAGGGLMGAGWLCKETVLYVGFVVGLYWFIAGMIRPGRWGTVVGVAVGFGAVLLAETLAYWAVAGDPWLRWGAIQANFAANRGEFARGVGGAHLISGRRSDLLDRLFVSGPQLFFLNPYYGGIILVGAAAGICAAIRRLGGMRFVGWWFVGLLLLFNFGPVRLVPYQPAILFDRYLYPLFYPAALLTAGAVWRLWVEPANSLRLSWGSRLVAGILIAGVFGGYGWGLYYTHNKAEYPATVRALARQIDPKERVYSDPTTVVMIRCYWDYPSEAKLTEFLGYSAEQVIPGSYVLVNRVALRSYQNRPRYNVPDFCDRAPEGWVVRFQSWRCVLYSVPPVGPRS